MGLRAKRFETRLERSASIVIDTAPMIYHLGDIEPWSELTRIALDRISAGEMEGLISTISVAELLVKPLQLGNREVVVTCEEFLLGIPNTTIVPADYEIARAAAELRASSGLRMPDALICATARRFGAAILTNDDAIERADIEELEVVLLSRYVR